MKLSTVYARFYKSFNFDHLRKAAEGAESKGDWEMFRGGWYPYVEVGVHSRITTIVGANESGKSHLLSAIEKAISGEGFEQRDLCRYSPFFSVEKDATSWPHLGVAWSEVGGAEADALTNILGLTTAAFDHFMMFREGPGMLDVWIPGNAGGWKKHQVPAKKALRIVNDVLPKPFRIFSDIALPASAPLSWLSKSDSPPSGSLNRRERSTLLRAAEGAQAFFRDEGTITANAVNILKIMTPMLRARETAVFEKGEAASLNLAKDLLIKLANVEPDRLSDLQEAIADGQDGYANALVESINGQLERHLNFKKWWIQDRDFSLKVTPREHELVFTIRDRTGTEYTFAERSSGLKYFLSYLIQARSHQPHSARESILLMDEPDTYLSAEAQQDLMKVFQSLADPEDDRPPVQVIYVTHSPFLLDKNHAERIRVLEKGRGFDGTRVVRNVSRNHYEPLRSAFGAFVGETAFVGSVNLLVEGVTDQVLMAGAARALRKRRPGVESDTLDLNSLVLVPCGSASQEVYMLYLVRGRDSEKPPVVALLDSDDAGDRAAEQMRTDNRAKRFIDKRHILQLGKLGLVDTSSDRPIVELEDVIPLELANAAMNMCMREVVQFREATVPEIKAADIAAQLDKGMPMFDAIQEVAKANGGHIEKLGFARAVVEAVEKPMPDLEAPIEIYLQRMAVLFREINKARREAQRESNRERLDAMVTRYHRIFIRDRKTQATREQGSEILEEIESQLDDTPQADLVRTTIHSIRRKFHLDDEPGSSIVDFEDFASKLSDLRLPSDLQNDS